MKPPAAVHVNYYLLVALSTIAYGLLEYYRTKAKRAEPQDDK